MEVKQCTKCSETKTVENFSFQKERNSYRSHCKACISSDAKKRRAKKKSYSLEKSYSPPPGHKKCKSCENEKPKIDFPKDQSTKDGYYPYCKECKRAKGRARRDRIRGYEIVKETLPLGYKRCSKCGEVKSIKSSFHANKTSKDGVSHWCRDCTRKSQKHYRKQNKVNINIRKKEYYDENKANILQKQKQYNEENKESKIAYKKDWYLNNRTRILFNLKEYREENKELIRIRKKLYREKNQEKIKALKKQYYEQNKDNINERRKLYREENKEKIKAEKKRYYEENKSSIRLRRKNEYQENKDGYIIRSRLNHKKKKKLRTKELNLFYTTYAVPKYLWHENEFANEKDFQSAIEHIIVNKYGIQIERWTFLEELGVPDIYLPEIDLIIEIKLHSSMWTKESVLEQSQRYSQISDTIVVSLDGMPEYWMDNDDQTNSIFWFSPEQLFKFIAEFQDAKL